MLGGHSDETARLRGVQESLPSNNRLTLIYGLGMERSHRQLKLKKHADGGSPDACYVFFCLTSYITNLS